MNGDFKRLPSLLAIVILTACATTRARSHPLFEFHDNFWLNLHHFARVVGRGMDAPGDLAPDERAAWDAAIAFYAANYSKRDLLFDDGMVAIKNELRKCDGSDTVDCAAIDPQLMATLTRIAPIYRKYWWPAHRASNEKWIAASQSLIKKYGATLSARVAAAYGVEWPPDPIPVDVTVTAGPNNAYTSSPPTHVTISSIEPTVQGPAALELLFHEPSHAWGQMLMGGIARAEKAHHTHVPDQLWHAVLFHNAGELTRRTLQENGVRGYVEYAAKYDIYRQLCGVGCGERVAAAWDRRLDGSLSVDQAFDALVSSWPAP
ncbi:MAG: hypothetical protein ACXVJT_04635 [Thermoanaerobaculia bacterium]